MNCGESTLPSATNASTRRTRRGRGRARRAPASRGAIPSSAHASRAANRAARRRPAAVEPLDLKRFCCRMVWR
jgi:hypothetical protein